MSQLATCSIEQHVSTNYTLSLHMSVSLSITCVTKNTLQLRLLKWASECKKRSKAALCINRSHQL